MSASRAGSNAPARASSQSRHSAAVLRVAPWRGRRKPRQRDTDEHDRFRAKEQRFDETKTVMRIADAREHDEKRAGEDDEKRRAFHINRHRRYRSQCARAASVAVAITAGMRSSIAGAIRSASPAAPDASGAINPPP